MIILEYWCCKALFNIMKKDFNTSSLFFQLKKGCLLLSLILIFSNHAFASQCFWDNIFDKNYPSGRVYALQVFDDGNGEALYVGGGFFEINGQSIKYIAKWDGTNWSNLGTGMQYEVNTLTVHDDGSGAALYAGGRFQTAGGGVANYIAKWNGTAWSPLGSGMNAQVLALASHDDGGGEKLYAGGTFTQAGGEDVNYISAWDGLNWSSVGSGMNGHVYSLFSLKNSNSNRLWAGGFFSFAGGVQVNNVTSWNGTSWLNLHPAGTNGVVRAITEFDDGAGFSPYIGGGFTTANVPVLFVAKYKFLQFLKLEFGLEDHVYALETFDDGSGEKLYAGGFFTATGLGVEARKIIQWDGSQWSALDRGLFGIGNVEALETFNHDNTKNLYVGGQFTFANTVHSPFIARWKCPGDLIFKNDFESEN